LEANFCLLKAFGPAIKIPFWDHWDTALFGPNPGREPFGSKFLGIWRPLGRQVKFPSGTLRKRPFWAKSLPGAFWKQSSGLWRPLGWLLKSPSGILGKRPFWAKSWPGALWKQISAICRPLGHLLGAFGTSGSLPRNPLEALEGNKLASISSSPKGGPVPKNEPYRLNKL
jgi:hypothetical protein